MKIDLERELKSYLVDLVIDQDNIGAIRRACFVPWDSEWNTLVRDVTAQKEIHKPEAP